MRCSFVLLSLASPYYWGYFGCVVVLWIWIIARICICAIYLITMHCQLQPRKQLQDWIAVAHICIYKFARLSFSTCCSICASWSCFSIYTNMPFWYVCFCMPCGSRHGYAVDLVIVRIGYSTCESRVRRCRCVRGHMCQAAFRFFFAMYILLYG